MLLYDNINYNKKWKINFNFPTGSILKSVVPYWEYISDATNDIYIPFFDFLSPEEIESAKTNFLVLDYTWEALYLSHLYFSIHIDCKKYGIPEKNVIILTGQLKICKQMYDAWFNKNSFSTPIAVFDFPVFLALCPFLLNKVQYTAEDKVLPALITFNRNPRAHRNALNYLIASNNINATLSQSALTPEQLQNDLQKFNINCEFPEIFKDDLVIDRKDFNTSNPVEWTEDLLKESTNYSYILVQETNFYEEAGFYMTEKTFKNMLFKKPVLIWGVKGINHFLVDLGFRPYDKFFDLSFDLIEDDEARLKQLFSEIQRVDALFKNNEDRAWRNSDSSTLEHNFNHCLSENAYKPYLKELYTYIAKMS